MSPITELTTVKLPRVLVDRLKALKKPHQALAGVIEELLNEREHMVEYLNSTKTPRQGLDNNDKDGI